MHAPSSTGMHQASSRHIGVNGRDFQGYGCPDTLSYGAAQSLTGHFLMIVTLKNIISNRVRSK